MNYGSKVVDLRQELLLVIGNPEDGRVYTLGALLAQLCTTRPRGGLESDV